MTANRTALNVTPGATTGSGHQASESKDSRPSESLASKEQVCDGDLRIISEHGQPHGIRDRGGYILFFPTVRKYEGQEQRYRDELAQSFRLADFLLRSLESSRETEAPHDENVTARCREIELAKDRMVYGTSYMRIDADGRITRIDPSTVMIAEQPESSEKSNGDVCTCEKPEPALMDHGMASLCEKCYRPIGAQK